MTVEQVILEFRVMLPRKFFAQGRCPSDFTIGILGGGQLGKMIAFEARRLSFNVVCLDPKPESPASQVCPQVVAPFNDRAKLKELYERSDVLTIEIEHVDTEAIKEVIPEDKLYPSINIIELIQDKLKQREFYRQKGLPIPDFWQVFSSEEIKNRLPCVQKSRRGGYDGRGVMLVKEEDDLERLLPGDTFFEELVPIEKELAVVVARDQRGNIKTYPVVEMVFDPEGNLLDYLLSPADIESNTARQVEELAISTVEALEGVGVFGVELFLTSDGKILLNEVAPRVHNSGHHTIEACDTSQFEQVVRVLTGLPLGSTRQYAVAGIVNLLGEKGYRGKPIYEGLERVLDLEGVFVHIYGKKETSPLRKMGHVTLLGKDRETVKQKIPLVKSLIKVKGDERLW